VVGTSKGDRVKAKASTEESSVGRQEPKSEKSPIRNPVGQGRPSMDEKNERKNAEKEAGQKKHRNNKGHRYSQKKGIVFGTGANKKSKLPERAVGEGKGKNK